MMLEIYFSREFGHVHNPVEAKVGEEDVLAFGKHGGFLKRKKKIILQLDGVSAEH